MAGPDFNLHAVLQGQRSVRRSQVEGPDELDRVHNQFGRVSVENGDVSVRFRACVWQVKALLGITAEVPD